MTRKKQFSILLFCFCMIATASAGTCAELQTGSSFILPQYSKRISLDFKDADLKDVLKLFSKQIGANFILSDKVKVSPITVFLEQVPVEDALTKILIANGLVYQYDANSNIFMVAPKEEVTPLLTRVFPLRYATVPSSKLLNTLSFESTSETSSSTSTTTSTTSSGIIASLESALTKDGKIAEDARTNSLVITDAEDNFPQIEGILQKLDVPVVQVLIEVEMLDVSKDASDQIGVKFGKQFFHVTGADQSSYFPFDQRNVLDKGGSRDFTAGSMGFINMSAVLEFLTTRTDTRNLARPRLLTLDNQTAQIKISTDEAVGLQTTTTSSGGSTGTLVEQAERVKTGVFLTVTPQVNLLSGEIMIAVSPKVIDATSGGTFGSTTFKDPEERGANVLMKVRAGETIIMGGLLRKKNEKIVSKIPVLGDIPFIGRLFRHENMTGRNRELLIFITPYIMNADGKPLNARGAQVNVNSRETSEDMRTIVIESELDRAGARVK